MTLKVHYPDKQKQDNKIITLCNRWMVKISEKQNEITCRRCLKILKRLNNET